MQAAPLYPSSLRVWVPTFSLRLKFILSACLAGSRRGGMTKRNGIGHAHHTRP
jgi:hypothetical protein